MVPFYLDYLNGIIISQLKIQVNLSSLIPNFRKQDYFIIICGFYTSVQSSPGLAHNAKIWVLEYS